MIKMKCLKCELIMYYEYKKCPECHGEIEEIPINTEERMRMFCEENKEK